MSRIHIGAAALPARGKAATEEPGSAAPLRLSNVATKSWLSQGWVRQALFPEALPPEHWPVLQGGRANRCSISSIGLPEAPDRSSLFLRGQ
ncbi:hypothetical protein B5K06_33105 [Rhizobium grahamii]|uniref:Uncharacterized protein n=1 Tax=Rhizobium grahamii TaxID=1120045 RepID=A0A370KED3_9HYPH|nr:hypothetical protein B5K06_33105 [Rhizobium grahamii]